MRPTKSTLLRGKCKFEHKGSYSRSKDCSKHLHKALKLTSTLPHILSSFNHTYFTRSCGPILPRDTAKISKGRHRQLKLTTITAQQIAQLIRKTLSFYIIISINPSGINRFIHIPSGLTADHLAGSKSLSSYTSPFIAPTYSTTNLDFSTRRYRQHGGQHKEEEGEGQGLPKA